MRSLAKKNLLWIRQYLPPRTASTWDKTISEGDFLSPEKITPFFPSSRTVAEQTSSIVEDAIKPNSSSTRTAVCRPKRVRQSHRDTIVRDSHFASILPSPNVCCVHYYLSYSLATASSSSSSSSSIVINPHRPLTPSLSRSFPAIAPFDGKRKSRSRRPELTRTTTTINGRYYHLMRIYDFVKPPP